MIEKLKNWMLPLLFGCTIMYTIIKCFQNDNILLFSLAFLVFEILLFLVFDLIRKAKKISGLLYVVLSFVVYLITFTLVFKYDVSYYHGYSFVEWFYMSQTDQTTVLIYTIALLLGGGFFFTSVLYYFTQIIYRNLGTMALILFPLFVYSKRLSVFETTDMIIIMILYLAIMVHNRQVNNDKSAVVVVNRLYIISLAAFLVVTVLITTIIPKPNIVSQQEQDSEFFNSIRGPAISIPNMINSESSNDSGMLSDRIIMYVESKNPMYLRRQSYDYYANGKWVYDVEFTNRAGEPSDWEEYVNNTTTEQIIKRTKEIVDYAGETYGYTFPELNLNFPNKEYVRLNFVNGFSPRYIMAPLNTVSIDINNARRTRNGEFVIKSGDSLYLNRNSNQSGYLFSYYPTNSHVYKLTNEIDLDYSDFIDMHNYTPLNEGEFKDIFEEIKYVNSYVLSKNSEIPLKVSSLAKKITQGLETPMEKAKALEGYFTEENFTYDVNQKNSSVENFLFKSQTGACADYATAMTLMAKSVGLKARYVEGFLVDEQDPTNKNTYIVREYHSHAFVEIYFNGVGWLTFEPTVAGFLDYYKSDTNVKNNINTWVMAAVILSVLIILVLIFKNIILEIIFRVKMKIQINNNEKNTILMYNRVSKYFTKKTKLKITHYTPRELEKSLNSFGIEISDFITLFEKVCYGLEKVSNKELKNQYDKYKEIIKSISKIRKRVPKTSS